MGVLCLAHEVAAGIWGPQGYGGMSPAAAAAAARLTPQQMALLLATMQQVLRGTPPAQAGQLVSRIGGFEFVIQVASEDVARQHALWPSGSLRLLLAMLLLAADRSDRTMWDVAALAYGSILR